jgi:hypothetical protein
LDGRYRTQANLIGFIYLFDIFVGNTLHWLKFFSLLLGLCELGCLFLAKEP